MKAAIGLFTLLLVSQALPWAIQPVHAQAANPRTAQLEDGFDGRQMQLDYNVADHYAFAAIPAYSVEQVTEKNKTLADGNQVRSRQSSMRYRDQDGRVRIAYQSFYGNERIFIADPRAKVAYLIRPDRKDILRIKGTPSMPHPGADLTQTPTQVPAWNKQVITSLGLKDFAGVKAAGTLTETFFPAGARGNEKDMVETREIWRSNQFPGYLYTRSFTPREGEQIVRLENLRFGEVPASLFAIPSDYAIRDLVLDPVPPEQ